MSTKTFTYGGFTFEPKGQFKDYGIKPGKNEMRNICCKLNNSGFGLVADGDEPFDYDEFYNAAGKCEDDVFLCQENGILYVPCGASLQIFTPEPHEFGSVTAAYHRRRQEREEEMERKRREELRNVTYLTEEQHQILSDIVSAVKKCREAGMDFVIDGSDVCLLRTDQLEDLTDNMVPMDGQTYIPDCCYIRIVNEAWDAHEGLYANPKKAA